MKKLCFILLALLPVISFLLLSCQEEAPVQVQVQVQDIIKIGDSTGDWGFPSPYGIYSRGPGYIRMSLIFDTLVWKNKDGEIIPMLAESWHYSEDKNSFTFNLRKDVLWHDGEPFTARDVEFTFEYIKKHPWVWMDSDPVESVKAINDWTVSINLAEKYAPFLNNIAGTLPILPRHIWKNIEEPLLYAGRDALIGTGPFILKDYSSREGSYLYEANKNYYAGDVNIEKIAFIKVSDKAMPAMIKSGNIDAGSIPPDVASDLKQSGFEIEQEPPTWAAKLILNHNTNELLSNKTFRHALAYAINPDQIVEISQRGFAVKGSAGLLPPANSKWYSENIPRYEYNPEKATEILEKMGWLQGSDGYLYRDGSILGLELAVSGSAFERDGEVIEENLEDIGIKIELLNYEAKTLDSKIENWDFDMAINGHGGLGGDPEILNKVITSKGFNSVRYYENEKLIELLNQQIREMDTEKRMQIVYEMQKIYAEELPSITLYYPQWYWAHNENADIFYTDGGVASGIPIPINKIAFIDF